MYGITSVVYGTHITKRAYRVLAQMNLEPEDVGFECLYSGSADVQPAYLGVELDSFDEGVEVGMPFNGLNTQPSAAQMKLAHDLWNKLPPAIQVTLPPIGLYLVFSTS
jgi:hypothetical protein